MEVEKSLFYKKPHEEIRWAKKLLEIDPQLRAVWYELGHVYYSIEKYDQAVKPLEKAMDLSFQWGRGWKWVSIYTVLGNAYHKLGKHDKEMEVYEKGLTVLPDHPRIIRRLAIEYLSRSDTAEANSYLTKYQSKLEEEGWSQARIMRGLGSIYWDADDLTNAEKSFRRALDMDPKDSATLNGLAYLLIDYDINVDEGMDLVQQALEIEPDEPEYLDTQVWGYYKLGRYGKSVELLEQAWEKYAYYEHDAYQHIEQAQSALAQ